MSNTSRSETLPPKATSLVTSYTVPISAVLSDLQRVLTVPFDLLRKRIVLDDSLDKNYIAGIRTCLEEQGLIVSNEQGIHWKDFNTRPATSKSQLKTFSPIASIINSILSQRPSCVVDYVDNPNGTPLSSLNNTSRPDGYLKLLSTKTVDSTETSGSTPTHWFDIAVPFEFKLQSRPESDTLDNEHKMIWSLHNIMREDPCRRFAYGITIEDVNVKLWLANRACVVVTKSINFLRAYQDIDDFISLFSALGAATDVALGWDPTIERILDTENKYATQYRIRVNETAYTTTDEIATFGADSLVGLGTRVYRAKDAQGNVVAIKDFWKDIDLLAEGKIIAEILKAIRDKFPTEAQEATKYFVSVKEFGDVIVNDSADRTVAFTEDGALPEGCRQPVRPTAPSSTRSHIPSAGNVPVVAIQNLRPLLDSPIPQRVHHRTVFHDVGTALQDIPKLKDSMACLRDTRKALYYMHKVGWIHRDYSVGNALQVVKDGQSIGKLSDFEYAKLITSNTCHDVRTGTMDFMAWEVDQQLYQFIPESIFPTSYRSRDMKNTSHPRPPFRMNLLHDLESVLWAYTWILLCNTDKLNPTPTLDAQRDAHHDLFPDHLAHGPRLTFLTQGQAFEMVYYRLSSTCRPAIGPLYEFARHLVEAYRKAEAPYPNIHISDDDIEDIHGKVSAHLNAAWEDSGEVDLIRVQTLYEQSRKRPIADAESPTKPPKKMR